MKKRVHVFYSGNVQGVGFRFTAERAANALRVSGWVKNLRDGRVEIVAEGDGPKLTEFLDRIAKGPLQRYIRDADTAWEDFRGEFNTFDIAF